MSSMCDNMWRAASAHHADQSAPQNEGYGYSALKYATVGWHVSVYNLTNSWACVCMFEFRSIPAAN